MEEVIEEGPWLFQGQPVVLQAWEQGMSLRRQKHMQVPIWIRIRHLPMDYWTEDGLSAVASGLGTPLYTDKITKNCLRLDFARVCVMLDYHSKLPKHLVVLSPILREGGRIWLAWNALEVGVEVLTIQEQYIHCSLLNKRTHTNCLISTVYGDCDSIRRRQLWGGLQTISEGIIDVPWCVLGDFNAFIDSSESCGRITKTNNAMAEFREFITESALVHFPFTGCPYTWHNCSEGSRSLWRRLDRVLVNEVWLVKWPHSSYLSAFPSTSDHSPLILLGPERRPERDIFRFDNFLARQPGFLNAVRGFFDMFKEDILLHLVQWCRAIYCKAVELENSMLRQRAKLNWFKHGDQCSNIFFRKINARRAKQRVYQISNSAGDILTESDQPHLKHTLTIEEANELLLPVTQEEIKEAFFDIYEDSAPGPDGYTSAFFKLPGLRLALIYVLQLLIFFISRRLLKQINATLLVLIPKVQLPVQVSEFCPIACYNIVYKAITKILVRRMQRVLHLLIDYSQNAFVLGRLIADNVLLA
ncbi:UNVERIFIED_CONTAM: hypothetical protein Slati_0892700 [Sesamum latifolium]|uniref:Reverse transcriptase n=1 Tax=Sesamum latifolium TaxID=2727402 RepID=A0AAW2XUT4_9LAMI